MMRNWWKFFCGLCAVAMIAMAGTTALAVGTHNLVQNSDIETITRFSPHELDHPNGYPDAWHHSAGSAWSDAPGAPDGPGDVAFTSAVHSLYIPDDNILVEAAGDNEMRSFATAIRGNPGMLDLSWQWKWDITSAPGDQFSATVRISKGPVTGFDLSGAITDHVFLTGGAASSGGGFLPFLASIPLAPDDQSFDIIFASGDEAGDRSEAGVLYVDDVIGAVPEPATMGLLSVAGLGLMMISRRRRG